MREAAAAAQNAIADRQREIFRGETGRREPADVDIGLHRSRTVHEHDLALRRGRIHFRRRREDLSAPTRRSLRVIIFITCVARGQFADQDERRVVRHEIGIAKRRQRLHVHLCDRCLGGRDVRVGRDAVDRLRELLLRQECRAETAPRAGPQRGSAAAGALRLPGKMALMETSAISSSSFGRLSDSALPRDGQAIGAGDAAQRRRRCRRSLPRSGASAGLGPFGQAASPRLRKARACPSDRISSRPAN